MTLSFQDAQAGLLDAITEAREKVGSAASADLALAAERQQRSEEGAELQRTIRELMERSEAEIRRLQGGFLRREADLNTEKLLMEEQIKFLTKQKEITDSRLSELQESLIRLAASFYLDSADSPEPKPPISGDGGF